MYRILWLHCAALLIHLVAVGFVIPIMTIFTLEKVKFGEQVTFKGTQAKTHSETVNMFMDFLILKHVFQFAFRNTCSYKFNKLTVNFKFCTSNNIKSWQRSMPFY